MPMHRGLARDIAETIFEVAEEDIITTCEGDPEDIKRVVKEFRKLVEAMEKKYL